MQNKPVLVHLSPLLLVVLSALASPSLRAEAPMRTDDAGTLQPGGQKIEYIWAKDSSQIGRTAAYGFSPGKHLEVGLSVGRSADYDPSASASGRSSGLSLKWVPFQQEQGWSAGLGLGRTWDRVHDQALGIQPVTVVTTMHLTASYKMPQARVLHVNLGTESTRSLFPSSRLGFWAIGYEFQPVQNLQVTIETYGQEQDSVSRTIGWRYQLSNGPKVSAAMGRDRQGHFAQVGMAWEF